MQYQRHRVVAALVLAPVDGKIHYVYRDGLVPLGVPQERLDDWLNSKLIEEVDGGPVEIPTAEKLVAQLAASGVTVSVEEAQAILDRQAPATPDADMDEGPPKGDAAPLPPGAPGRTAKKEKWVAFAVTLGMDEATAKAATQDELIARAEALAAQA